MKKTITSVIIFSMMILNVFPAYANVSSTKEVISIQDQVDALIKSVDKKSLINDAMENVVDYSVPLSVRKSIFASADFTPINKTMNKIKLEVNSTAKKVGQIVHQNDEVSNMYVAIAVVSDPKLDTGFKNVLGITAWTNVYWIDNWGPNNELVSAGAEWDPGSKVVNNRVVRYGTSDPTHTIWFNSTTKYPTINFVDYRNLTYTGLTFRCQSKIDIVNVGTVTCNVGSSIFTR